MNANASQGAQAAVQTPRADREKLLGQRGRVIWLTGLSGAGKTTIARAMDAHLHGMGRLCAVLDGDVVRTGLNRGLGFSEEDRHENIRRIAEVARILLDTGVIVLVAVISPAEAMRQNARKIVGAADFFEVYVRCSIEVCNQRDTKGLYKKAQAGQLKQFTGVSAPYEPPAAPDLIIDTDQMGVQQATEMLLGAVGDLGAPRA
ncbi:MAG: adenylyl-sulfate kinase [Deltaproteobacteria bacterium]|nr:adenylyl-sulfate kinase [Deltaproteobacteria bacterium]